MSARPVRRPRPPPSLGSALAELEQQRAAALAELARVQEGAQPYATRQSAIAGLRRRLDELAAALSLLRPGPRAPRLGVSDREVAILMRARAFEPRDRQ